jgi:predicted acetyltransferase
VTIAIRPAREQDLDRLVDVHTGAYPDARGYESRVRNFVQNPLGAFGDLRVLEVDGVLVAHAFLFRLGVWVGGACVPAAGIASVGVAAEARGRGLGSKLVEHLHAEAHARGDAFALLYPFRQAFYARLGYAPAASALRLRLHPASIPWRCAMRARTAEAGDLPAMKACWEAAARPATGRLARGDGVWERRLADERSTWLVVEGAGGVEGYVRWVLAQSEAHAATTLVVRELASTTAEAERALWGLVGAQRDQVAEVRVDVAADAPVERALVDADRARFGHQELEHAVGDLASGPMVRLLDVRRALASRGWPHDGSFALAVDDAAGAAVYEVVARDGSARVDPTLGPPDLRLDARALAAVAFGGLRPADAVRLGWASTPDAAALARADALLALPPYFSPDPF